MKSKKYQVEQVFPASAELTEWRIDHEDDVLRLAGDCLECHDWCVTEIQPRLLLGGAPASVNDRTLEEIPRAVVCNCERAHEGRPGTVLAGCGRFWMVMVREHSDQTWSVAPLTDESLFSALRMLAEDERTQESRIRGASEKWVGAVAAIYGLFSIAGVVAAKDALAGIVTVGRLTIALLYVAALATAAVALLSGYVAAYGWPTEIGTMTVEDVRKYRERRRQGLRNAARRLRRSVFLACATLLLLSVMVMVLWLLPRAGAVSTPPNGATPTQVPR
jgi:hypothetical protein